MSASRTLISIEVTTPTKIWNRTYLADFCPTLEQYECYYRMLCGFQDATLKITKETVPEGFNEKLLKPLDTAPTVFPLSDLETEADTAGEEKRRAYTNFIKQLVQMEINRISLNFFVEAPKAETWLSDKDKERIQEYRSWVDELLDALSEEIPQEEQTTETVGWILAPAAEIARRMNGYRLITNQEMGRTWEPLLGTDHFPDLVVAQKLHTSSWSFQHELSTELYKSVLHWYMNAKGAIIYEGVSDWLPRMDTEIRTLIAAYLPVRANLERTETVLPPKSLLPIAYIPANHQAPRTKEKDPEFEALPSAAFPSTGNRVGRPPKVVLAPPLTKFNKQSLREEFINTDIPVGETPKLTCIKDVLRHVETLLAPAVMFADSMEPCGADVFQEFVDTICSLLNLTDAVLAEEMKVFKRWEANQMGFRPDLYPIIAEWYDVWRTIIRTNATVERIRFFIKTVTLEKETTVDTRLKETIVDGWIKIFTETHLIVDPRGTVQSLDLHEQCKLFCLQFMPPSFTKYFTPMTIGPYFTKRGFQTRKRSEGRYTHGIRYRRPDEKQWSVPSIQITSTFQQTTMTSASGSTIQHISSTTEINLGRM